MLGRHCEYHFILPDFFERKSNIRILETNESDLDLLCRVDSAEQAFEELKKFLETHHLVPQTAQEQKAPGIAKTRG